MEKKNGMLALYVFESYAYTYWHDFNWNISTISTT